MFIVFDSSLIENLSEQDFTYKRDLLDILDNATYCIKNKRHYVSTSKSDVAKILSDFGKENSEKKIAIAFNYIFQNFATLNSPKQYLKYYINIGKYEGDFFVDGNTVKINYLITKNPDFWEKTFLLPENMGDNVYFNRIVKHEQENQDISVLKNIKYDFRPEQGGGGKNINQIFLQRIKEHSFIFAILDTDKNGPSDNYGNTYTQFASDLEINKYENLFYYIPEIHEIENLFSSESFMKLTNYNRSEIDKIKNIENRDIPNANKFRMYLDIKLGYTYKSIEANSYLNELLHDEIQADTCPIPLCTNCKGKNCKRRLIAGAGGSYMKELFSNSNLELTFNRGFDELLPEIKDEWNNIFNYIITTCCINNSKISGLN